MASTVRLSLNLPLPPRVSSTAVSLRGNLGSRVTFGKAIQGISQRRISDAFVLPVGGRKPVLITGTDMGDCFTALASQNVNFLSAESGHKSGDKGDCFKAPPSRNVNFLMKMIRKWYRKLMYRKEMWKNRPGWETDFWEQKLCYFARGLGDRKDTGIYHPLNVHALQFVDEKCQGCTVKSKEKESSPTQMTVKHLMRKIRGAYRKMHEKLGNSELADARDKVCYWSRGMRDQNSIILSSRFDVKILEFIEDECGFGAEVNVFEDCDDNEIRAMKPDIDEVFKANLLKVEEARKNGVVKRKLTRGVSLRKRK